MTAPGSGQSGVHAILLAAGASKRFGDQNKLLAEIGSEPLVRKTAKMLLASRVAGTVVVTGFEASKVGEALSGLGLNRAFNADYEEGLSSSLRCGIDSLPAAARGALVMLADMPGVSARLVNRLIDAFEKADGNKIVFPVDAEGVQGNPVIWPRRFFADLRSLEGDRGAKAILAAHKDECAAVTVKGEAPFRDIDAPEDVADWQGK